MYTIHHLPSSTYYCLQSPKTNKHSIVCFKKYEHAKYIADSISTHIWIHRSLPEINSELCIMKPYQKKNQALENKLWVKKQAISNKFIQDVGSRNLEIALIDELSWIDDDKYNVNINYLQLNMNNEAFIYSLALDNEILFE